MFSHNEKKSIVVYEQLGKTCGPYKKKTRQFNSVFYTSKLGYYSYAARLRRYYLVAYSILLSRRRR